MISRVALLNDNIMSNLNSLKKYIPYGIFMILALGIFAIPIGNLDELWNYNFARGIAKGLLPYADFNMILTPMAAWISAIYLKVLGDTLVVYRFAGYCLLVSILNIFYSELKEKCQCAIVAFIVTLLILELSMISFIYEYNYLSLLAVLLIMKLESKENLHKNLLVGVLVGVLPIIKQSTGGIIFLINALICLYFLKAEHQISYAKKIRLIVSFFPGILFIIYLLITETFFQFVEYAVVGISSFVHKITIIEFMTMSVPTFLLTLLPIGMIIFSFYQIFIKKKQGYEKIVYLLFACAWFFGVTYPLFDIVHYTVGVIPLFLVCGSLIGKLDIRQSLEKNVKIAILVVFLCLVILVFPGSKEYKICELEHYKGILIHKDIENQVKKVCDYIKQCEEKNIEVHIADISAATYMIPLNSYTKHWDLLVYGNLGTTTIEELLDFDGECFLLVPKNEYRLNPQSYFELIEYIKKNYKKVDEVQKFDVYRTR